MRFQIFLTAMNVYWNCGGRVLLGDSTGGRVAVFSPIRFQSLVEWISVNLQLRSRLSQCATSWKVPGSIHSNALT